MPAMCQGTKSLRRYPLRGRVIWASAANPHANETIRWPHPHGRQGGPSGRP